MKFYLTEPKLLHVIKGLPRNLLLVLIGKLCVGMTWAYSTSSSFIFINEEFSQNSALFPGILTRFLRHDSWSGALFPTLNESQQDWNWAATLEKSCDNSEKLVFIMKSGSLEASQSILILIDQILRKSRIHCSSWHPAFFILIPLTDQEDNYFERISTYIKERNILIPLDSHLYFLSYLEETDQEIQCSRAHELYSINEKMFSKPVDFPVSASFVILLEILVTEVTKRRKDFELTRITGIVVEYISAAEFEVIIADNGVPEIRLTGGVAVEPFWFLRDALNFRESILKSESYVKRGPNGTLKGMAIPVNEGLADIAISTTEFLLYRMQGPNRISYLHISFRTRMQALFVQPPVDSVRHLHALAFSWDSWVALSLMWILLIAGASMASVFYRYYDYTKSPYSMFIWVINCIALQGGVPANVHFSMEVTAVGFFFGLVCFAAFSGNLVSLFSQPVIPIKSLQDILSQRFLIYSDSFIPSSGELVKGLERLGMIPQLLEGEPRNVNVGVKASVLAKGRAAVISAEDSLVVELLNVGWSPDTICSVFSTTEVASEPLNMAMFVKRGSPFKKIFNVVIVRMMEGGVGHRILSQYFAKTTLNCLREEVRNLSPVGIGDVLTLYIIFLSGLIVATGLLAIEVLFVEKRFRFIK